jgi:hypothetical protein
LNLEKVDAKTKRAKHHIEHQRAAHELNLTLPNWMLDKMTEDYTDMDPMERFIAQNYASEGWSAYPAKLRKYLEILDVKD